jgi:hypothetical protein
MYDVKDGAETFGGYTRGGEVQTRNNGGGLQYFMTVAEAIRWADDHNDHRRMEYVWKLSFNDASGTRRRFTRSPRNEWVYDPIVLSSGRELTDLDLSLTSDLDVVPEPDRSAEAEAYEADEPDGEPAWPYEVDHD